MHTTSATGQGHSDAANRSTGATCALFAGHVCPCPAAEAPAGPARRARRASPRPTPVLALALFCLPYRAPAQAPDKMDGPPLCAGLRAAPIALRRLLRLGGRARACGAVAPQPATWGGVASGAFERWSVGALERSNVRTLECLVYSAPSHAAPAPAASAWSLRPPRWLAPLRDAAQ